MKKGTITKSIGFQILLYLLFGLGVLAGSLCLLHILWLWDYGAYYGDSFTEYEQRVLKQEIDLHGYLEEPGNLLYAFPDPDLAFEWMEDLSEHCNLGYVVTAGSGSLELFSSAGCGMRKSPYAYHDTFTQRTEDDPEYMYTITVYVDPAFPKHDSLYYENVHSTVVWQYRYAMI